MKLTVESSSVDRKRRDSLLRFLGEGRTATEGQKMLFNTRTHASLLFVHVGKLFRQP
jgi:hypothetical protein